MSTRSKVEHFVFDIEPAYAYVWYTCKEMGALKFVTREVLHDAAKVVETQLIGQHYSIVLIISNFCFAFIAPSVCLLHVDVHVLVYCAYGFRFQVHVQAIEMAKILMQELENRFPSSDILSTFGILYPQYQLQEGTEEAFPKHLQVQKKQYYGTRSQEAHGAWELPKVTCGELLSASALDIQQSLFKATMKALVCCLHLMTRIHLPSYGTQFLVWLCS